jgi:hypothetical protein
LDLGKEGGVNTSYNTLTEPDNHYIITDPIELAEAILDEFYYTARAEHHDDPKYREEVNQ